MAGAAAAWAGERGASCDGRGQGAGTGAWAGIVMAAGTAVASGNGAGRWLYEVARLSSGVGRGDGEGTIGILWIAGSAPATAQADGDGRDWLGDLALWAGAQGSATAITRWCAGVLQYGIGAKAVRWLGPMGRSVREIDAGAEEIAATRATAGSPEDIGPRGSPRCRTVRAKRPV